MTDPSFQVHATIAAPAPLYGDIRLKDFVRDVPAGTQAVIGPLHRGSGELDERFRPIHVAPSVSTVFPDGAAGFLPADTSVFPNWQAIAETPFQLWEEPRCGARSLHRHQRARLTVLSRIDNTEGFWLKVRDHHGHTGYIEADALLRLDCTAKTASLWRLIGGACFVLFNLILLTAIFWNRLGNTAVVAAAVAGSFCVRLAVVGVVRYMRVMYQAGLDQEARKQPKPAAEVLSS